MTNPVSIDIPEKTVTKIAGNTFGFLIARLVGGSDYYITFRPTGSAAPTPAEMLEQTLPVFENELYHQFSFTSPVDAYMLTEDQPGENISRILYFDDDPSGCFIKQATASRDGVLTSSYSDDYIVRGNCFNVEHRGEVGANASVKDVIDFSDMPDNTIAFLLPIRFVTAGGEFWIDTYFVDAYTGGTVIAGINAKDTQPVNVADGFFAHNVTYEGVTTLNKREYLISGGSNSASARSGSGTGSNALIFTEKPIICIDFQNKTNAAARIQTSVVWFEIPLQ